MSKIFIKIFVPALVLFLQSCNMSKHYANMRIDNDDAETMEVTSQHKADHEKNIALNSMIILPVKDSVSRTEEKITIPINKITNMVNQKNKSCLTKLIRSIQNTSHKIIQKPRSGVERKRKPVFNKKATKDFDGTLSGIIVAGIIIGLISGVVAGSAGVGFLVALGIVLLIIVGVIIGISLIIMLLLGGIFDFFSNR